MFKSDGIRVFGRYCEMSIDGIVIGIFMGISPTFMGISISGINLLSFPDLKIFKDSRQPVRI
jgi:hypothetical protein